MKFLKVIKTAIFYKFLLNVYKSKRFAFYVICMVIILHLCANAIKSNIFPVFIYSMYSEPQHRVPTTTSRYIFFADSTIVPIHDLFVEGRLSAPIDRYLSLSHNGGEDPIINKRAHYLTFLLPLETVNRIKSSLYSKSFNLKEFKNWYVKYFYQYIPVNFSTLSIYQYEYSFDDLTKPIKTTHIISIYE